jgi:hypothetical protein
MTPLRIELDPSGVHSQLSAPEWWKLEALRSLVPGETKIMGHDFGPDPATPEYAYLAVDARAAGAKVLHRSFVRLAANGGLLICCDLAETEGPAAEASWRLGTEGQPERKDLGHRSLLGKWQARAEFEALLVNAVQAPGHDGELNALREIYTVDLAGVQSANWVVLFHTDTQPAKSAIHFEAEGKEPCRILITGVAAGEWQIWCNGWLEDRPGIVKPQARALYFSGDPGSYFLRRME